MGLIFGRKKSNAQNVSDDNDMGVEVEAIKKDTHQKMQRAADAAADLNSLLRANGITLNISIATGGHDRGK